jgi:hypothetical protein
VVRTWIETLKTVGRGIDYEVVWVGGVPAGTVDELGWRGRRTLNGGLGRVDYDGDYVERQITFINLRRALYSSLKS